MEHAFARKKRRAGRLPESTAEQRQALFAQIGQAAGRGARRDSDPAYQAGMQFRQTFDAVGMGNRRMQGGALGETSRQGGAIGNSSRQGGIRSESPEHSGLKELREPMSPVRERALRRTHDSPVYSHSRRQLAQGSFCDRFASYAFSGGVLAGAVLEGRGEMMLTSCMERAAGNIEQKKILAESASEQKLGGKGARVVTNGDAHSAVGLVVSSIRSATRTLDAIKSLAEGSGQSPDNPLEQRGVQTMRELYPFLRLREDDEFIARCKTRLGELEGDTSQRAVAERQTVSAALTKAQAVREQKKAQQRSFLTKLSEMRANAARAEELFTSDGFAEYMAQRVSGAHASDDEPPDDSDKRRKIVQAVLESAAIVGELIADAKENADPDRADVKDGKKDRKERGKPKTST